LRGSRAVAAVALTTALSACVFGGSGKTKSSSGQIGDRDLAVPAVSVPSESTTTSSAASTEASTSATSDTTSGPSSSGGRILTITDPPNDVGAPSPGYADAVEVTVDDDGGNARVRVRMRTSVPLTLADREVMGVGVNINDAQAGKIREIAEGLPLGRRGR